MAKPNNKPSAADVPARRYPLHRAPFLFAPHFLSAADWYLEFEALITRVLKQCELSAIVSKRYGEGRQASVAFQNVNMTIDGDGGLFMVGLIDEPDEDNIGDWGGPLGPPEQFFQELKAAKDDVQLRQDYEEVRAFAELLHNYMRKRFERAVRERFCSVIANVGGPLGEERVLDFWQLDCLRITSDPHENFCEEDFDLDEAVADGVRLVGLGAVANPEHAVTQGSSAQVARLVTVSPSKRGAPEGNDWLAACEEARRWMRLKGVPGSKKPDWKKRHLGEKIKDFFEARGEKIPSPSTVNRHIDPIIAEFAKPLQRKQIR